MKQGGDLPIAQQPIHPRVGPLYRAGRRQRNIEIVASVEYARTPIRVPIEWLGVGGGCQRGAKFRVGEAIRVRIVHAECKSAAESAPQGEEHAPVMSNCSVVAGGYARIRRPQGWGS